MRCHPCNDLRGQRGAALVVAMLVFAVCAALGVALAREFQLHYQRGANLLLAEQAQAYLRGAEDLATLALVLDYDEDRRAKRDRDDLTEIWAREAQPYPLDEGGWLVGSLEDLQGRYNLNHLSATPSTAGESGAQRPRFTPEQRQFIRLLQALPEIQLSQQEAVAITQSITDWLDQNNAPGPNGAEDDYYLGLTPAYRAANRPMGSVSELLAVANMTPEIYTALSPWVTVWPSEPGELNIHTAGIPLLRSINADSELQPLSEAEGEELFEYRRDNGFVDKKALAEHPVFSGIEPADRGDMNRLLGVESSYFLLRASVEVAERRMHLYSVLHRANRTVTALARASGSL